MTNYKKKNKLMVAGIVFLGVLILSVIVSLGVRLGGSQTYTKLAYGDYVVGTLNETGEFTKSGGSFVTEEFTSVDGLKITVKEDADLSYRIYFYGEDDAFISSTNSFAVDYNGIIPESAETFKIVITPMNDDDISLYDIMNYSADVEVKFYK